MIYEQTPVRLQLTVVGNVPNAPIDQSTGGAPRLWRSSAAAVAVGLFDALGAPVDLANLVASGQIQLAIFRQSTDLLPVMVKTVSGASIYPKITTAGWEDGSQQNATFLLTAADMDIGLGGAASADFWILIQGTTSTGTTIPYAAGAMTIFQPGSVFPVPPFGYVSRNRQTNDAGNSTAGVDGVIPSLNHTQVFDIGGAARTTELILPIVGMVDGAKLAVILNLPATADIILNLRNSTVGGTIVASVTTGTVLNATLLFDFDEANQKWEPYLFSLPGI